MAANQYGRAIAALGEALSWLSESNDRIGWIRPSDQSADTVKGLLEEVERRNDKAFSLIRKALKHIAEA